MTTYFTEQETQAAVTVSEMVKWGGGDMYASPTRKAKQILLYSSLEEGNVKTQALSYTVEEV